MRSLMVGVEGLLWCDDRVKNRFALTLAASMPSGAEIMVDLRTKLEELQFSPGWHSQCTGSLPCLRRLRRNTDHIEFAEVFIGVHAPCIAITPWFNPCEALQAIG